MQFRAVEGCSLYPHVCRLEIPGNAVQKEFLLDSLLLQPLPLPFACLLAVKSIFHYYSWQWQLVVGFSLPSGHQAMAMAGHP